MLFICRLEYIWGRRWPAAMTQEVPRTVRVIFASNSVQAAASTLRTFPPASWPRLHSPAQARSGELCSSLAEKTKQEIGDRGAHTESHDRWTFQTNPSVTMRPRRNGGRRDRVMGPTTGSTWLQCVGPVVWRRQLGPNKGCGPPLGSKSILSS